MSKSSPTLPGVTHHHADLNGTRLHYVSAGTKGPPSCWSTAGPRPGGPSVTSSRCWPPPTASTPLTCAASAPRVRTPTRLQPGRVLRRPAPAGRPPRVGPLHVLCQDISGGLTFDFAVQHPEDVKSFTGVETALIGFGLEALADVNNGGAWHVGFLGAPGIPQLLLPGHERDLITWAYRVMGATAKGVTPADLEEFVKAYTGPDAWNGTSDLYQAVFSDKGRTKALASAHPCGCPCWPSMPRACSRWLPARCALFPLRALGTWSPRRHPASWRMLCWRSWGTSTRPADALSTDRPRRSCTQ